jgi:rare lipoprotein A
MVAIIWSGASLALWSSPALAAPAPAGKVQKGVASFYDPKDAGKPTASGKPLDPNRMTAASPTLPLGTRAKVVNTRTGQSAQVTVTDRGPYAKGRVIDVTPKAAKQLGMTHKGVAPVVVKPVSKPR